MIFHPYGSGSGFEVDDGASLLLTFRGLQAESAEHGQLHREVSRELYTLVAEPFQEWTEKHKVRLRTPLTRPCDQSLPLGKACASERTSVTRLDH